MVNLTTGPFNKDLQVSKIRAEEPYVQQKVNLPATLVARFNLLHMDPVAHKPRYGAASKVFTKLLTDYVNKAEREGPMQDV